MAVAARPVKVAAFHVLLAAGLAPAGLQAMPGRTDPAVQADVLIEPPAGHVDLDAFRGIDLQDLGALRRAARDQVIAEKQARLVAAVERARDAVQAAYLHCRYGERRPGPSGPTARSRRHGAALGGLALLAGAATAGATATAVIGGITNEADTDLLLPPAPAPATPYQPQVQAMTDALMAHLESYDPSLDSPMVQNAVRAQRAMVENALGASFRLAPPVPPATTPGAQLVQGAFITALSETSRDIANDILPTEFGPIPSRLAPRPSALPKDSAGVPECPELVAARAALDAAKRDVMGAIREAKSVGSDIVIAALSLLNYGSFGTAGYSVDIGSSVASVFSATPTTPGLAATGALAAAGNMLFAIAYSSDAIAGAVTVHKLKEVYIDALLGVSAAEDAWRGAYTDYQSALRRALYSCPSANGTQESASPPSAPAPVRPSGGPLAGGAGVWGPSR